MKVLIVVDMQNDFISGALGSEAAQAIVPKIKEKIDKLQETHLARASRLPTVRLTISRSQFLRIQKTVALRRVRKVVA